LRKKKPKSDQILIVHKWDKWQQEVLAYDGNISIRSGRQVGKSEIISEKAKDLSINYSGINILIIAASQRQSSLLFEKVRAKVELEITKGTYKYEVPPTLTRLILSNGTRIYCLPTGRTGYFIRGFTIDVLIADEAAYIPESVWIAITPMLAVSKKMRGMGWFILLSTPFGKGGFYYDSFFDKDFKSFHVSSEDCPRISQDFLRKERQRMTKQEYAQEYLGEFIDEYNQFFTTELIKNSMKFIEWDIKERLFHSNFYLGVDIARYGGDENAFVIVELYNNHGIHLKAVKCHVTSRVSTTDTIGRIIEFNKLYNFKKIFIDSSGVGGAVFDVLFDRFGRKVIGLENASKRIEIQGHEKQKGILKEDLYSNLLMLLETNKLELISDLSLLRSLKSITFRYNEFGRLIISGNYSHLTEALVRAVWCIKERGLDIYFY